MLDRPSRIKSLFRNRRRRPSKLPRDTFAIELLEDRVLLAGFGQELENDLIALQAPLTSLLAAGSRVPLVGTRLANDPAAAPLKVFADQKLTGISEKYDGLSAADKNNATLVGNALFDILGPNGTNLIANRSDLVVTINTATSTTTVTMRFNKTLPNITLAGGFGLGLTGLPFNVTAAGGVNVSEVKFTQNAVFTFNTKNNTGAVTGALNVSAKASLIQGSAIQATIGFLKATLTDTGTTASVQFSGTNSVKFDAHVKLFADATFAGDTQFPSVSAEFGLDWNTFSNTNATPQSVRFDNVSVSLGQFISNLLRPIVEKVQIVTQPIQPVIDFLKTPVPGVSDLAEAAGLDEITVQDIIRLYGKSQLQSDEMSKQIDMYLTVASIIDQINGIHPDASLKINVGNLNLTPQSNTLINGGTLSTALAGIARNWEQALDSLGGAGTAVKNLLKGAQENIRLTFPLIQDPLQGAFKLFVGQHADLVILDLKYADGSKAPPGGSIYGIAFGFNGGMAIDSSLRLGYDTYGISKFLATGDAAQLADGFYLHDSTHFTLSGDIGVYAGGGIVVFSVSISGGLQIPTDNPLNIRLNMGDPSNQPDHDFTKLHFDEVDGDCLFHTSGKVVAGVEVIVTVGVEIPNPFGDDIFVGYTKEFEIASEDIFDFGPVGGSQCLGFGGGGQGLQLASLDSFGNLTLAMGPNVGLLHGPSAPSNGNEDFFVESVIEIDPFFGDISKLWVHAYGYSQSFPLTGQFKVQTIYADGGIGDDSIIFDESVKNINVIVHGGLGNDRLEHYGSGSAVELYGDGGNDLLAGGDFKELMDGGGGNDLLIGRGGSDILNGGEDHDKLFGGSGNDNLAGGDGDDEIDTGGGQDFGQGGRGADTFTIYPGIGAPVLYGGLFALLFVEDGSPEDKLIVSGSKGPDFIEVTKVDSQTTRLSLANDFVSDSPYSIGIEHIFIEPGTGADQVIVNDLTGTVIKNVVVNQREFLNPDKNPDTITVNASAGNDTVYVDQLVSLIREGTGPTPPKGVKYRPDEFGTAQQVTFLANAGTFDQMEKYHVWTPNSAGDKLVVNTLGGSDQIRLSSDAAQLNGPTGYVEVDGGDNGDTIFVRSVTSSTDIRGGGGDDLVVVGELGVVDLIRKSLFIEGGIGNDTLIFSDNISNSAKTGELSTTGNTGGIIGFGMGGWVFFGTTEFVDMRLGSGDDRLTIRGTPANAVTRSILIDTGAGADTVDVFRTSTAVSINGRQGLDTVNVGQNGSVQGIGGTLTVTNPGGYSAVNIDDSADTIARTVIVYNNGFFNGSFTVISGLTPGGDILLRGGELRSLSILAGTPASGAGNTFRIHFTPFSTTPGGLTTAISTGGGPDQVNVNGTFGALALNAQGGGNLIYIGSNSPGEASTASLDGIIGRISVTGLGTLYVLDTASTTGNEYVIDQNFIQRLDKARIDFQGLKSVNLNAGAATDHILVQDTIPSIGIQSGTTIYASGGDDRIDVSRTTGRLDINAANSSVIEVGNAQTSLSNIQGAITVSPSGGGNYVTLSLNDQAATTPQQLDITPGVFGPLFKRTGAADINVFFNPLGLFQWTGGNGSNTVNVMAPPAWNVSTFTMGDGGGVVNVGTAGDSLFSIGGLSVIGGAGFDQLLIRDQGTTTSRLYDVRKGKFVGQDSFGILGAGPLNGVTDASIYFDHVDAVTFNGGGGGNLFKIAGTPLGTSLNINTGAGADTVDVGNQAFFAPFNSLRKILGPLTLDGQSGQDQVTFNDQGTVADENYTLYPGVISTTYASPDYHYSNIETLNINGSAGATHFGFSFDPGAADPFITLDGGAGGNTLAGPHVPNVWQITGKNAGTLNDKVAFSSIQSFFGGSNDDNFVVADGASIDGSINGLGGVNALDYSAYTMGSGSTIDGLISRYKAEGDFTDSVGGNDGTPHNGATFAPGRVGDAISLDGVDDYIQVSNDPSLEPANISVEAWLNSTNPSISGSYILSKGSFGSYAFYAGDGTIGFFIGNSETSVESPTGPNIWDGNWHHVVGTFDGATVRLYVDGAEVGSGTPTDISIGYGLPGSNGLFIGGTDPLAYDSELNYSGLIDELSIYNRALSASEIQALYAPAATVPGLVSLYKGEGDFTDAVDGNDGTPVNEVSFAPGQSGQAFTFDGVDDYIRVPRAANLEPSTVTVEAWVNYYLPDSLEAIDDLRNVYILAKGANKTVASSYALYTGITSGLSFYVYDGDTFVQSPEASLLIWDGNWHHVVGTYDGTSVRLYVDGQEVGNGTPTNIDIAYGLTFWNDDPLSQNTDDLFIGTYPLFSGRGHFPGFIDELSIYNRALTAEEVEFQFEGGGSGEPGNGVVVNLQLGTATGLSGGIDNIQNVIGSSGNDILVGNGGNVLSGGAGRDLLISGAFASVLNGGEGDDILIAGTTDYDADPTALNGIMAEWSSAADYANRVAELAIGANGSPILDATTVHSNGGGNTLDGDGGLDYFFSNMDDLDTLYGDPLTEEFVEV